MAKAPPQRPTPTSTGGRTALTPELGQSIADAIEAGSTFTVACEANGVGRTAGHDWQQRGEAGEQPFADFAEAVRRAHARAKTTALHGIKSAMTAGEFGVPDWKAMREWLAVTYPEEFAPHSTVELKVRGQAARDILARIRAGSSEEEYRRILGLLLAGSGDGGTGEPAGPTEH